MRLIGFIGYARSGKDTAARLIGGYPVSFANKLKADLRPILRERYGLDPDRLTPAEKEMVRPLMVEHGRIGRKIRADMWIEPVVERLQALRGLMERGSFPSQPLCVPDCRYLNEAHRLIGLGATLIYIIRPGYGPANDEEAQSIQSILNAAQDHAFPVGRFHTVCNDGSLEQFAERLRTVLEVEDVS